MKDLNYVHTVGVLFIFNYSFSQCSVLHKILIQHPSFLATVFKSTGSDNFLTPPGGFIWYKLHDLFNVTFLAHFISLRIGHVLNKFDISFRKG